MLKDRSEAARLLLKKLLKYEGRNPLVVGIPRGAMPMAKILAEGLRGELNAILVHKIPAPHQEEFAIGSVGLSGVVFRLPYIEAAGIPEAYVQKAAAEQVQNLLKRKERFHFPDLKCTDRIVILVDDGVATGATAMGAIHEIRLQKPKKLILAAAVVPATTAQEMREAVDEFIVLEEPECFYSVSQFFEDFSQVTDDEVMKIFEKYKARALHPLRPRSGGADVDAS